uniref:Uncharacterized protein n=1 Tax=Panagrolaimus davidi TaxID=227884 RepID=A0A914PTX5_9BILA
MSNKNNSSGGRQLGEDDARALFNALEPALRNLLIEEIRRSDASQEPPENDWDFQPIASTSSGNLKSSSTQSEPMDKSQPMQESQPMEEVCSSSQDPNPGRRQRARDDAIIAAAYNAIKNMNNATQR